MADARLSHAPLEAVVVPTPDARLSQAPVEVVVSPSPDTRLSQAVLEVVVGSPPGFMVTGALLLTGAAPRLDFVIPIPGAANLVLLGHGVPYDNFIVGVPAGSLIFTGQGTSLEGVFDVPPGSLTFAGQAPLSIVITQGRLSQLVVEYTEATHATAHLSQLPVEVLVGQAALAQLSQLVVEVLHYSVDVPDEPCVDVHCEGCPTDLPVPLGAAGGTGCVGSFTVTPTVSECE